MRRVARTTDSERVFARWQRHTAIVDTILRGNAAEAAVLNGFVQAGVEVMLPFGGGFPFDLGVLSPIDGTMLRVQVKSGRIRNGCVTARRMWGCYASTLLGTTSASASASPRTTRLRRGCNRSPDSCLLPSTQPDPEPRRAPLETEAVSGGAGQPAGEAIPTSADQRAAIAGSVRCSRAMKSPVWITP